MKRVAAWLNRPHPPVPGSSTAAEHHGDVFIDPYEWLRDKEKAEGVLNLKAETEYTETVAADRQPANPSLARSRAYPAVGSDRPGTVSVTGGTTAAAVPGGQCPSSTATPPCAKATRRCATPADRHPPGKYSKGSRHPLTLQPDTPGSSPRLPARA